MSASNAPATAAVASLGVVGVDQQQEALRQVRANLASAATFLTQCGDVLNLRAEPIEFDVDVVRFAELAWQAEEIVVAMLRLLPEAPLPTRPWRKKGSAA